MTTDTPAAASRRRREPEPGGHRRSRRAQPAPSGGRGGRRRKKQKSTKKRVFVWIAFVLALVLVGGGGGVLYYLHHLNANLAGNSGDLTLGDKMKKSKANAAGQTPMNILLLGSDSRDTAADKKLGGASDSAGSQRADVEMLLHVSADRSNASVISIPRDTRVPIPSCRNPKTGKTYPPSNQTINASLDYGGPGCTVATWYKLTGIPIDHYMMVDFGGVVHMADAIGGVPVCVDANVHDPLSHLRLTKGTHKVKGVQALEWLRTRHGFEDGSDVGRTHAQHMYMNSLAREMKSDSTMGSPSRLMSLAETGSKELSVDKGLASVDKLYSLAKLLKGVDLKRMTMLTMPYAADPQNPTAHLVPTTESSQLFSMIRNDVPLDKHGKAKKRDSASTAKPSASAAPKGSLTVSVKNGSLRTGRAAEVTTALQQKGFAKAATAGNTAAPSSDSSTAVVYPKGDGQAKADAQSVAAALKIPAADVKEDSSAQGVTLEVGADWPTGSDFSSALPKAGSVPKSARAQSADDSSACMKVNPVYTF